MHQTEATIYFAFISILTLLILISSLFLASVLRQIKLKSLAQRKILQRELNLMEKDRERIAADLHDDIGSSIAVLVQKTRQLGQMGYVNTLTEEIITDLEQMRMSLKDISANLVPRILLEEGLITAINDILEDISLYGNIKTEEELNDLTFFLHPEKSLMLYRIIQEIITNTVRHSKANRLIVRTKEDAIYLYLSISDNGKGFQLDSEIKSHKHFGLANIRSRLELLDAEWQVHTKPGNGTAYEIKLKIKELKDGFQ
jgi:two-component system NarL family sensor kinase